jgi:hypothetical protein
VDQNVWPLLEQLPGASMAPGRIAIGHKYGLLW